MPRSLLQTTQRDGTCSSFCSEPRTRLARGPRGRGGRAAPAHGACAAAVSAGLGRLDAAAVRCARRVRPALRLSRHARPLPVWAPEAFRPGAPGACPDAYNDPPGQGLPSPSRDAPDAPSLPSARPCVAQGRLSPPPALEALRNLVGTPVVQVSAAAASKQMLRLCSLQGVESVCGSDAARARLLGARAAAWPGGRPLRAARQAAAQAPPVGLRLQPPPSGSRAPLPATASRLCRFCRSVSRESAGSERVAPRSASRVCGAAGPPRAAPQCRS